MLSGRGFSWVRKLESKVVWGVSVLAGSYPLREKNKRLRCITLEPSAIVSTDESEQSVYCISHRCYTLLSICTMLLWPRDFLSHYCLRTMKWATGASAKKGKKRKKKNKKNAHLTPPSFQCDQIAKQCFDRMRLKSCLQHHPAKSKRQRKRFFFLFFF